MPTTTTRNKLMSTTAAPNEPALSGCETLADDLLYGASAIGDFIGRTPRQVFHYASLGALPIFRTGKTLTARKSQLIAYMTAQGQRTEGAEAA